MSHSQSLDIFTAIEDCTPLMCNLLTLEFSRLLYFMS